MHLALPIHVSQSFLSVEVTDAKQASLDMPWFYICIFIIGNSSQYKFQKSLLKVALHVTIHVFVFQIAYTFL